MIVINRQYCRFDSQILRSFSPGCPVGIKLRSVVSFTADYLYDRFYDTFSYTFMEAPLDPVGGASVQLPLPVGLHPCYLSFRSCSYK